VAHAVKRVPALAFGNTLCLFGFPLSAYFFMKNKHFIESLEEPSEITYAGMSSTVGIFLCVAQAVQCVLAVAF